MSEKRSLDMINDAMRQGSTSLSPELEKVRERVSEAFEEMITFGSRPRPLRFDGSPVGYVRGLAFPERAWVNRMYEETDQRALGLIRLATTVPEDLINQLTSVEIRRLLMLITHFGKADTSLLAWAYPFTTTSTSERLYNSSIKTPDRIRIPNGEFHLLAPSDAVQQWRYLAYLRNESKEALRSTSNSAMIVQAMVGKGAQQLTSDLQQATKELQPNLAEPWLNMGLVDNSFDADDGWGHIHQDSSHEGLLREFQGMLNNDKHEQLMRELALQQRARAEAERDRIKKLQSRVEGISYSERALTEAEVKKMDQRRREAERIERERRSRERSAMLDHAESAKPGERVWDIEL